MISLLIFHWKQTKIEIRNYFLIYSEPSQPVNAEKSPVYPIEKSSKKNFS